MPRTKPHSTIQAVIEGDVHGQVAVGENIVQIGTMHGGVVLTGDRRIVPRPVDRPVRIRPRPAPWFVDREDERATIREAASNGIPVHLSGVPGIGKTTVLRQLAHELELDDAPDGIVFLSVRGTPLADVRQLLFDVFYETELPFKAREGDLVRLLAPLTALVLLDDVGLERGALEALLDLAPQCTFVTAGEDAFPGSTMVTGVAIEGLPIADAADLVEREFGRPLDAAERTAARLTAATLRGHPLRLVRAAAAARDDATELAAIAEEVATREAGETAVVEGADGLERDRERALSILASLRGAPLRAIHVAALTGGSAVEDDLAALVKRKLVVRSEAGYSTDIALERLVPDADEREGLMRRVVEHLARAAAEATKPEKVAPDAEAFRSAARLAAGAEDWKRVRPLTRALGLFLPGAALWGAWSEVLGLALDAARGLDDRAFEAWALHESGTRAKCLDPAEGRDTLTQALEIREALGDQVGAAVTRHNLEWVPPPDPGDGRGEDIEPDAGAGGKGEDAIAEGPGIIERLVPFVGRVAAGVLVIATGAVVWRVLTDDGPREPGRVGFEPAAVAFATQPLGTVTDEVLVTLTNAGGAALDSVSVGLAGPDATEFLLEPGDCPGASLPPGAACEVRLSFVPTTGGPRTARLEVRSWPGDEPVGIELTGTGVGEPGLELQPEVLEFNDALVGTAGGAREVAVVNRGTADANVERATIRGPGSASFAIDQTGCQGRTLPPGADCRVRVEFVPLARAVHTATLSIEADGDAPPAPVTLTGRGTAPVVAIDRDEVVFGRVGIRTRERASVRLENAGDGPLDIAGLAVAQGQPEQFFAAGRIDLPTGRPDCESRPLEPGESCEILVDYVPLEPGDHFAELRVEHSAETGTLSVPLLGTGVGFPVAEIRAPTVECAGFAGRGCVDFGQVAVGRREGTRVGLINRGAAPLDVRGVGVASTEDRPGARFFDLPADECTGRSLAPGESCTVDIVFVPGDVGEWLAELEIVDNAEGSPRRLPLRGVGTGVGRLVAEPPALEFSPDLRTVAVEAPAFSQRLALANAGNASVSIRAISISGRHPDDFRPSGECERVTLLPGDRCVLTVGFRPTAGGLRVADLVVETTAPEPLVVPLEGRIPQPPPPPPPPPQPTAPDLVVSRLDVTGAATPSRTGFVEVPVAVTVTNHGAATGASFKISVESDEGFMRPLTVPGQPDPAYPVVVGLGAGRSRTLAGVVTIQVGDRRRVGLLAIVDSCSGDEFMPSHCRVDEADEDNNRSATVPVSIGSAR